MATTNVTLSSEELALILRLLEGAMDETRVELHHTHSSPAFRESLKGERKLLLALSERFRTACSQASS